MNSEALPTQGEGFPSSERNLTIAIVLAITLASLALLLSLASPELTWDEADYSSGITHHWSYLWDHSHYRRHNHGPMAIYLAKLGDEILPASALSIEFRLRFFEAIAGSLAVGLIYAVLRHAFQTSRSAALVGSSLLLFDVIRLTDTYIIGPHHLMLLWSILLLGLGYQWRNTPNLTSALGLGLVLGFAALSMTYTVPATICWALSVAAFGQGWISFERWRVKISPYTFLMLAIAAVITLALWPAALFHFPKDFYVYLSYPGFPTFVGDRLYEITPHWAAAYWLAHFDLPFLVVSFAIIFLALWNAYRAGHLSAKHGYLFIWFAFFFATMIKAHMAGSRNLILFIGVAALITGALFDEALGGKRRLIPFAATTIIAWAAINLFCLVHFATEPAATSAFGYKAFIRDNRPILADAKTKVILFAPILKLYCQQEGVPIACDLVEYPWFVTPDTTLPPDAEYALMSPLNCDDMPLTQPMRRIVSEHWKLVWDVKAEHGNELRLYQKP